ncbi:MAG: hypothetical protein ACRENM_02480 [Candidatus Dormibacteraceae bacterium]
MSDDGAQGLAAADLEAQLNLIRARMRPLEEDLQALRTERDVLLTEARRRHRQESRESRRDVKEAMRSGAIPAFTAFIESAEAGAFSDYIYTLKTGGEVELGFAGAKAQSVALTDGRETSWATDLAESHQRFLAGWDLGTPGRPGLRVHFSGTRQERLVDPGQVFVRPRSEASG